MISCYRRISHFVSANKRNLFCDTSKLSPIDTTLFERLINDCKKGITKTGKQKYPRKYQMLRIGRNIVLQVSNPNLEDKENIGCAIQVDVGSDDSPHNCLGLSHLLEHVICRTMHKLSLQSYDCCTLRFKTIYSFNAPRNNFAAEINYWAKLIFEITELSTYSTNMEEIISCERERVDNEFHESRYNPYNIANEVSTACLVNTERPKFSFGNKETLKRANELKLNELRELNHQRPVVICIYSAHELEMVINWVKMYLYYLRRAVNDKAFAEDLGQRALERLNKLPPHIKKAAEIASHLDGNSRDFDEANLYSRFTGAAAAQFIFNHLLNNSNIVHMVVNQSAASPGHSTHSSAEQSEGVVETHTLTAQTEPNYGTQFFIHERSGITSPKFKFWNYTKDSSSALYHAPIGEPKDVAFQTLESLRK